MTKIIARDLTAGTDVYLPGGDDIREARIVTVKPGSHDGWTVLTVAWVGDYGSHSNYHLRSDEVVTAR